MRRLMTVYDEAVEYKYGSVLDVLRKRFDVEVLCIKPSISTDEYNSRFSECCEDYVCSLDMAGFQMNTLLDYPSYDVMMEKQMHIIINETVFPQYAEDDFALNLFLYVPEDAEKWRNKYPHIPNIDAYERLEQDAEGNVLASEFNERVLNTVIDRFLREAG